MLVGGLRARHGIHGNAPFLLEWDQPNRSRPGGQRAVQQAAGANPEAGPEPRASRRNAFIARCENISARARHAPILLDCATIPGSNLRAISGLGRHP
jgi:hypothetical protein